MTTGEFYFLFKYKSNNDWIVRIDADQIIHVDPQTESSSQLFYVPPLCTLRTYFVFGLKLGLLNSYLSGLSPL